MQNNPIKVWRFWQWHSMHLLLLADYRRRRQFAEQLAAADRVRDALRSRSGDWSVVKSFLDDLYFLGVWLDDMHDELLAEYRVEHGTVVSFYPDDWSTLDDAWLQLERELNTEP